MREPEAVAAEAVRPQRIDANGLRALMANDEAMEKDE